MTEYAKNKLTDIVNGMSSEERLEVLKILLSDKTMRIIADDILNKN